LAWMCHPGCGTVPEGREVRDQRALVRLESRLAGQELDGDALALRRHPRAVAQHVAGLLQDRARLAQQRTVVAGAVGDRRQERLAEHFLWDLPAKRLEHGELLRTGFALGLHVGVLEQRLGALVE